MDRLVDISLRITSKVSSFCSLPVRFVRECKTLAGRISAVEVTLGSLKASTGSSNQQQRATLSSVDTGLPADHVFYVAWRGEASESDEFEVPKQVLQSSCGGILPFLEGDGITPVMVQIRVIADVDEAEEIILCPSSSFDWDVVSSQAEYIENNLLQSMSIVAMKQALHIPITPSLRAELIIKSIKMKRKGYQQQQQQQQQRVARINNSTSLVIEPYGHNDSNQQHAIKNSNRSDNKHSDRASQSYDNETNNSSSSNGSNDGRNSRLGLLAEIDYEKFSHVYPLSVLPHCFRCNGTDTGFFPTQDSAPILLASQRKGAARVSKMTTTSDLDCRTGTAGNISSSSGSSSSSGGGGGGGGSSGSGGGGEHMEFMYSQSLLSSSSSSALPLVWDDTYLESFLEDDDDESALIEEGNTGKRQDAAVDAAVTDARVKTTRTHSAITAAADVHSSTTTTTTITATTTSTKGYPLVNDDMTAYVHPLYLKSCFELAMGSSSATLSALEWQHILHILSKKQALLGYICRLSPQNPNTNSSTTAAGGASSNYSSNGSTSAASIAGTGHIQPLTQSAIVRVQWSTRIRAGSISIPAAARRGMLLGDYELVRLHLINRRLQAPVLPVHVQLTPIFWNEKSSKDTTTTTAGSSSSSSGSSSSKKSNGTTHGGSAGINSGKRGNERKAIRKNKVSSIDMYAKDMNVHDEVNVKMGFVRLVEKIHSSQTPFILYNQQIVSIQLPCNNIVQSLAHMSTPMKHRNNPNSVGGVGGGSSSGGVTPVAVPTVFSTPPVLAAADNISLASQSSGRGRRGGSSSRDDGSQKNRTGSRNNATTTTTTTTTTGSPEGGGGGFGIVDYLVSFETSRKKKQQQQQQQQPRSIKTNNSFDSSALPNYLLLSNQGSDQLLLDCLEVLNIPSKDLGTTRTNEDGLVDAYSYNTNHENNLDMDHVSAFLTTALAQTIPSRILHPTSVSSSASSTSGSSRFATTATNGSSRNNNSRRRNSLSCMNVFKHTTKNVLKEALSVLLPSAVFRRLQLHLPPSLGLLLTGPPGSGKTSVLKDVCHLLQGHALTQTRTVYVDCLAWEAKPLEYVLKHLTHVFAQAHPRAFEDIPHVDVDIAVDVDITTRSSSSSSHSAPVSSSSIAHPTTLIALDNIEAICPASKENGTGTMRDERNCVITMHIESLLQRVYHAQRRNFEVAAFLLLDSNNNHMSSEYHRNYQSNTTGIALPHPNIAHDEYMLLGHSGAVLRAVQDATIVIAATTSTSAVAPSLLSDFAFRKEVGMESLSGPARVRIFLALLDRLGAPLSANISETNKASSSSSYSSTVDTAAALPVEKQEMLLTVLQGFRICDIVSLSKRVVASVYRKASQRHHHHHQQQGQHRLAQSVATAVSMMEEASLESMHRSSTPLNSSHLEATSTPSPPASAAPAPSSAPSLLADSHYNSGATNTGGTSTPTSTYSIRSHSSNQSYSHSQYSQYSLYSSQQSQRARAREGGASGGGSRASSSLALRRCMCTMEDIMEAAAQYLPVSISSHGSAGTDSGSSSSRKNGSGGINWRHVGGYRHVRRQIIDTIKTPLIFHRLYRNCPIRLPRAVLLYGPPGCGKTHLAQAAGAEFGIGFFSVRGPELLNKYIGASEKAVRDLFQRAKDTNRPSLLFFDEFESLAPRRGKDNTGVTDRIVNQLLTFIDGVEANMGTTSASRSDKHRSKNADGGVEDDGEASDSESDDEGTDVSQIFIMAATSRPDLIDAALLRPGRIETHIYVGLPAEEDRRAVLKIALGSLEVADDVDIAIDSIVSTTFRNDKAELFSPADWKAVVNTAFLLATHAYIDQHATAPATATTATTTTTLVHPSTSGANRDDVAAASTGTTSSTCTGKVVIAGAHLLAAYRDTRASISGNDLAYFTDVYRKFKPDHHEASASKPPPPSSTFAVAAAGGAEAGGVIGVDGTSALPAGTRMASHNKNNKNNKNNNNNNNNNSSSSSGGGGGAPALKDEELRVAFH